MKIKCDLCGTEFEPGNNSDGIPNGAGFMLDDGTVYNFCTDCLVSIGIEKAIKMKGDPDEMQNSDT